MLENGRPPSRVAYEHARDGGTSSPAASSVTKMKKEPTAPAANHQARG
jgi:hypothetical protein